MELLDRQLTDTFIISSILQVNTDSECHNSKHTIQFKTTEEYAV